MASIFKRKRLRPIPDGAKITSRRGKNVARWTDGRGRIRTVPVNAAGDKIVLEGVYVVSFTDHDGKRRTVSGTADLQATKRIAAKIEAQQREYRLGSRDAAAEQTGEQGRRPIADHLVELETTMAREGRTVKHIGDVKRHVTLFAEKTSAKTLRDVTAHRLDSYAVDLRRKGLATRTINAHIRSIKRLTRWAWENGRLTADPLASVKLDLKGEQKDRRVVRRALDEPDLLHLIEVTCDSPPFTWVCKGEPGSITGEDRRIAYLIASGVGLRQNEIRNLYPSSFQLAANPPTIAAVAAYAKGGRGGTLYQ